jgi:hypothetical protein
MKKLIIVGAFFQVQPGEPHHYSGICGTLWGSHHYKAGEVKSVFFSGFLIADYNFGVFNGEITDEYGKATIQGTRKAEEEIIHFDKVYSGVEGASPVHYKLTKENFLSNGELYYGHYTIEGAVRENNGWATCTIISVDENLFSPDKFKEEIDAEKAKW